MERRKFTREFKLEAVRLIKERGVSYAQSSGHGDGHRFFHYFRLITVADKYRAIKAMEGLISQLGLPRAYIKNERAFGMRDDPLDRIVV
jgi:hypothetical protein